jgi:hypothetical protein
MTGNKCLVELTCSRVVHCVEPHESPSQTEKPPSHPATAELRQLLTHVC